MPKTSKQLKLAATRRINTFARGCLIDCIRNVLDDPSGMDNNDILYLRQLAKDLSINFDGFINQIGSEFEIERLKKIETGELI